MKFAFIGSILALAEKHCTHWTGLRAAFKRSEHDALFVCARKEQDFLEKAIQYKPDIVVYNIFDMFGRPNDRKKLRAALPNAKICVWYADARTTATGQIFADLRGTVDHFFITNDGQHDFIEKHFGLRPRFLPQAVEPVEQRMYSEEASFPLLFIGGKYTSSGLIERNNIIERLEIEMELKVLDGGRPIERSLIYQAMPAYYGSATFTLDISHFWDINKYASNRFYVIPGMYGLAMTKRFPGCTEIYPEGTRVYWDTVEDLYSKMEYFLAHPKEADDIRLAGWEWAKKHHTYDNRITEMLDML